MGLNDFVITKERALPIFILAYLGIFSPQKGANFGANGTHLHRDLFRCFIHSMPAPCSS